MRPKDVRECVDIVARHPVHGPRYGDTIADLKAVWLGLLGLEAIRAVVAEDPLNSSTRIVAVGVSAFVSEEFLSAMKKPPFFWVCAELTRRVNRGDSPLLSDRDVREANAKGGLNLVTWEGVIRPEFWSSEAVINLFSIFVEVHRGFLLNEVTCQGVMSPETLGATLRSGGMLLGENGQYVESVDRPLDEIFRTPHHVGLTRELALYRPGTLIASLFAYQRPRCGFRPSEQRLLIAALRGKTDEDLADDLGISLSAVKKAWLSIYDRVSINLPSFFPNSLSPQQVRERGREKKQHLIAYLRDHPEELRPAAL